ncbi:MAG: trypsin-like peptidase domain-containing protein [candidate division KSB1 bacterium]
MFENKNAGGWALALVALGLFIGLVLRGLIRKDHPPEDATVVATMLPQQEEHPRALNDLAERFERVTTQCLPFIVTLQTAPPHHSSPLRNFSGVLMSPEGYILTSAALVHEAKQLSVTLSNKKNLLGEVLGRDGLTDIAVVKISASGLKGIRQGNSEDARLGQWVMALGNAALDRHAATAGIINMKGRGNAWLAEEEDFLQIDAMVNAHNVGGALVDLQGRLVGINFMREATRNPAGGSSLAIPVNMAREVMRRIIAEGKFVRGALAVELQEIDAPLALGLRLQDTGGALVSAINEERAAMRADLQRGDVVIKWGDKKIANLRTLRELAAASRPGTTVPITIIRAGSELMRAVTVIEARDGDREQGGESTTQSPQPTNKIGLAIEPLTLAFLRELKLPLHTHGAMVSHVARGSAADRAGILAGDIIQEWEGKSVASVKDFRARWEARSDAKVILIYLLRGSRGIYCALEVGAPATTVNAP